MSVVLITGASAGIGRALAIRAARAGYDVVAVGRNREALASLKAKIEGEGGRIATKVADVAHPHNARAIVALARERFGRLDVLVNNAGHTATGPLAEQTDAALTSQFGTHVVGPLALVREALEPLRASRGQVVMVGSGVARVPVGGLGAYPPSKAALRSATAILRRELRADGIAVTYVDPGVVDTAFMTRAGMSGAPARLLVSPEEVARKLLLAMRTRPAVVNAVPWQTAFVALAELFPWATELVLTRNPELVGTQHGALAAPSPALDEPAPAELGASLDAALEPVRRRMERVKLSEPFVRGLLETGRELDADAVALAWAGMPNKHERAATVEVLDALAEAGFLARDGERYRVVRTPA